MRYEVARWMDEAQTVASQGCDRRAGGHHAPCRVLPRRRVEDRGDPAVFQQARDQPQVIEDLRAGWLRLRRDVRTV